ncbi:MAG: nucleotidyltransferase domain-containing protein [Candidatus Thorarchaeota archaeon]
MTVDVRYIDVLKTLHSRLHETDITWIIGGSLALALEGLDVTPRDIDLFTDKEGAYKIEELFAEFLVRNVSFSTKDNIRSHYGALNINGIEVEIIGFIEFQNEDGTWYGGRELEDVKWIFKLDNIEIPLMKLESQLKGYKRIGRKSRITLIEDWLKSNTSK